MVETLSQVSESGVADGQPSWSVEDRPLVSVVLCFLNGEQFMEEAVQSVFAQTYDSWELLLVDDGSLPPATTMARQYARQHPERVRYLEHPGHVNRGLSASRNLGIRNAAGSFVAFLDVDDVFLPHKLKSELGLFRQHPEVAMVYGPCQHWFSWDPHALRLDAPQQWPPMRFNRIVQPREPLEKWIYGQGSNPGTCAVLVRTEAAREAGMFEESFTGLFEDQVFLLKICFRWPTYLSSEIASRYRQHPASMCRSSRHTRGWDLARLRFLTWTLEYLEQQGQRGTLLWRSCRRTAWFARHRAVNRLVHPARVARWKIRGMLERSRQHATQQPTPQA